MRAIIDAAARILPRRGYVNTTTNEIASRAGVSIGSLYEYFRDKDAIVRALLERHLDEGEAIFEERAAAVAPIAPGMPLEELIRLYVKAVIDFHAKDPGLHQALAVEAPLSRAMVRRLDEFERRIVDAVDLVLRVHPEAQTRSPRLAAQLCVQIVDGLANRWVVDEAGEPIGAEELTDEVTALLFAYVAHVRRAPS